MDKLDLVYHVQMLEQDGTNQAVEVATRYQANFFVSSLMENLFHVHSTILAEARYRHCSTFPRSAQSA